MRLKIVRLALSSVTTIGSIAVVASLSLAGSTAHAQTLFTGSGCSGDTFEFCGSWTATYIDATHISLFITNTSNAAPASNANSMFTQVGIGNVTVADPSSMLAVTGWQFDPNINGFNGFGLLENRFGALNTNINNALAAGTSQTFSFTFGSSIGTFTQATTAFSGAQIAIADSGSPGANCITPSRGVLPGATTGSNNFDGPGCAASAVPEPSTYLLMTTGLIGIFVAARRRRVA